MSLILLIMGLAAISVLYLIPSATRPLYRVSKAEIYRVYIAQTVFWVLTAVGFFVIRQYTTMHDITMFRTWEFWMLAIALLISILATPIIKATPKPRSTLRTLILAFSCILILGSFGATIKFDKDMDNAYQFAQKVKLGNKKYAAGNITQPSMDELLNLRNKAIKKGLKNGAVATVSIPSVGIDLPVYNAANPYTLAMGVALDLYPNARPGHGNYVVCGHNMEAPGVLISNLRYVAVGNTMELFDGKQVWTYRVTRNEVIDSHVKYVGDRVADNSIFALPKDGDKPRLTIYTCADGGYNRRAVSGFLEE